MTTEKKTGKPKKSKKKKAAAPKFEVLQEGGSRYEILQEPELTEKELKSIGVTRVPKVKVMADDETMCVHGRAADGLCPHCIGESDFDVQIEGDKVRGRMALRGPSVPVSPQDRLAGLFGKAATDLELDLETIGKSSPGPWEVGFGYEQSDPGTFIAGQGMIIAAEQDDTDCVLRQVDAAFMARARTRWPELVEAVIDRRQRFDELTRRYREWAGMKACRPAVRELLRRIATEIDELTKELG